MTMKDNSPRALPSLSKPGLLVMDVDGTLVDEEVIDLLGQAAGTGRQIADITERAMAGELDFSGALQERVLMLAGLPVEVFQEIHQSLHLTPGTHRLINSLHHHQWKVGLVSGGFHEVVDLLSAELGIDRCVANRLDTTEGRLNGRLLGPIVTRETKLNSLSSWAAAESIAMSQTVAMGDGANDIPMIQAAGLGIAFCARPVVRSAAGVSITKRDMNEVLGLLMNGGELTE